MEVKEMYVPTDFYIHDLMRHGNRVCMLAFKLCNALNLNVKLTNDICMGAILHDVGKFYIPKNILLKRTSLTNKEFEIIKLHSLYSYNILSSCYYNANICNIAKHHHEDFNGSGYPDGLEGIEICLGSRIVKICDVYDALTSDRVYRNKYTGDEAIQIMEREIYKFDVYIFNIFEKNFSRNYIEARKSF